MDFLYLATAINRVFKIALDTNDRPTKANLKVLNRELSVLQKLQLCNIITAQAAQVWCGYSSSHP